MLATEHRWTLIGCGLVAHADDILEVGEWETMMDVLGERLEGAELDTWLALLSDRSALEAAFSELEPPPAERRQVILEDCWKMALADGHGSDVEAAVHDRIADRLGLSADEASKVRSAVTARAGERAEVVVAFAAAMANLDGRMDSAEAVAFDELLGRLPLPVSRRLELAPTLYSPPALEQVSERLQTLPTSERKQALREIAPFVKASRRGDRERALFLRLAQESSIGRDEAERIIESA